MSRQADVPVRGAEQARRDGRNVRHADEYGETPQGRVAHIYQADEDVSLCGWELVRGVTDATSFTLCRKCERLAATDAA